MFLFEEILESMYSIPPTIAHLPQPSPGTRLLCIGDDSTLLHTREEVLSKAGYVVHACTSRAALRIEPSLSFEFALICRSVPFPQSRMLAEALRAARPSLRTILLKMAPTEEVACFDFRVDSSNGPVSLLRDLDAVIRFSRSARSLAPVGRAPARPS